MLAKKKLRTGSCEIALLRLRASSALSGFMKHPLGVPSAYLRVTHQCNGPRLKELVPVDECEKGD